MMSVITFEVISHVSLQCTKFVISTHAHTIVVAVFHVKVKVKAFPYSIPSVGPGADPDVQAVSPLVTVSHPPGGRLPLPLGLRLPPQPTEHHRRLAGTKVYCF